MDLTDLDTRQRIMEVAMKLFAVKGFDGASIREIAKLAEVNVSALNYHFKSKENLRQELMQYVVDNFKKKIEEIPEEASAADFAVKVHETLMADSANCLNQFKLILDSEHHPCLAEPYPKGYQQLMSRLRKELSPEVPEEKVFWATNIIFSYLMHVSVMSSTKVGKTFAQKFFPDKKTSFASYIRELVETLVRDLNSQY